MENKIHEDLVQTEEQSAFVDATDQYGKKIRSMPKNKQEIGVEVNNEFYNNIIEAGLQSMLDMASIQSFSQVSQNRNMIYDLLDTMCEDPTIAAVLETYAEDATEYAENGKIVWCESSDSDIANYVNYLLNTINVDNTIAPSFIMLNAIHKQIPIPIYHIKLKI